MSNVCEYCRLVKPLMSEDKSYYDYGFKVKKYWICADCQIDDDNKTKIRLPTAYRDFIGYEGLLRIIKELSLSENGIAHSVNFYDAAREAYAKDIHNMDKNYRPLWEFTYRIVNEESRIIINMHHDGDYDVCLYPDGDKDVDINPGYIQAFGENEKEKKEAS